MILNEVKTIVDNIDDFIEIQDGISQLRKIVITLAVSGKLVAQDKKYGTAKEFYKKIKGIELLTPIKVEEIPFEVPQNWIWLKLGDITKIDNGYAFKSSNYVESGMRVIRIGNVQDGFISDDIPKFIDEDINDDLINFKINTDDLLMSLTGNVGRVALFPERMLPAVLNQRVARIIPVAEELKSYLFVYFQSSIFRKMASSSARGMAQQNMSTEWLKTHLIPIPPLSEQKLIVKKVEELMKQLDDLEIKKQKSDETRTCLARSAMQSLGKGESKIAFDNLTELIKTSDDIKELEGALLTLAVSGKLVQQDKKDGTAEDLYKKILVDFVKKEKEWSGRKRSTKKLPSISSEKISFDIPNSWKWVRLDELFLIERGGSPRPIESYITDDPEGFNWIKIGDTERGGKYIYSTKEKILKSGLKKSRMVYKGDLLLTNSMSFGRPYILKIDGCIHDGWLVLRPYSKNIDIDLFYYLLSSSLFSKQFADLVSGAVVKNLNADKVKSAIIPLPPLDEQKRIVKKIEEIMVFINQLRDVVGGNKSQGRGRPKK